MRIPRFLASVIARRAALVTFLAGSLVFALLSPTQFSDLLVEQVTLTPVQQWGGDSGTNLPPGQIDNWAPTGIQDHTFIVTRGADNEGTRISGIDATNIRPGAIRFFVNLPTGASPPTDSGTVTFMHESTDSTASNRIQTSGAVDCTFPMYSVVGLIYGGHDADGNDRWRLISSCGWTGSGRASTELLALYPNCAIGNVTPISGTLDDWHPTCYTPFTPPFWIAGATTDSWDYTTFNIITDAGGATLTGLYTSATQTDPKAHGPIKILRNLGPGSLTLKHLNIGSSVNMRFNLPQDRDLILKKNESIILYSPFNNAVDLSAQWYPLAIGTSNEVFPSITTSGTTELDGPIEFGGITTPAALASGTTQNYNPGSRNPIYKLTTNAAGSTLGGLVAPTLGDKEIHYIQNLGPAALSFTNNDPGSTVGNRFSTPRSLTLSIAAGGGAMIRYDETNGFWAFLAWTGDSQGTRSSTNTTTTNCFPTWTDANGTLSSTCSTSDNGSTLILGASRLITISGSTTFSQIFAAPGSIVDQPYWTSRLVPAALTSGASNDNWNPASIHTKVWIVVQTSTSSLATLTGLNFGGSGELKVLCNFGPGPVKIINASASSSASNRFALAEGIDTTLPDNATGRMPCIAFRYDSSNTQWEEMWRTFEGANPSLPVLSSCGSSPTTSTNCTNAHCTITTGSGATACTITFGNGGYTNEPTCTVTAEDGTPQAYTKSATAITVTTAAASAKYDMICGGG